MRRARRRAAGLALALALGAAACRTGGFDTYDDYDERPGPYDALSPVEVQVLAEAWRLRTAGDLELARRRLDTLTAAEPMNLVAAVALQEVELDLLAAGEAVPGVPAEGAAASPIARLFPVYAARAEAEGTAAACVLAARLQLDVKVREVWLARALAADPECVWAHYGLASTYAKAKQHALAWASLERALALDPGHPPARRLEAELLARGGDLARAIQAYRVWLEHNADDPRSAPTVVAAARLDLASLLLRANEPEEALAALEPLDGKLLPDPTAAGLARVAALDQLGRFDEALAEARRLAEASPLDPWPRVQEALLQSDRLHDPAGARAAWEDVLLRLDARAEEVGAGSPEGDPAAQELGSLFLRLRASAELARLYGAKGELEL